MYIYICIYICIYIYIYAYIYVGLTLTPNPNRREGLMRDIGDAEGRIRLVVIRIGRIYIVLAMNPFLST